jgi:hypothetical protein
MCRTPLPLCARHCKDETTKLQCPGCFAKGTNGKDEDRNDDFCANCQDGGGLICCDGCSNAFHEKCLNSRGHDVPADDDERWECPECCGGADPPSSAATPLLVSERTHVTPQRLRALSGWGWRGTGWTRAVAGGAAASTEPLDMDWAEVKEVKEEVKGRGNGKRKARRIWTADEEEALRKGIKKCVLRRPSRVVTLHPPKSSSGGGGGCGGAGSEQAAGGKSSRSGSICSRGARRRTSRTRCDKESVRCGMLWLDPPPWCE